jgi:tetratricopeptide (TPR) repeat protein
VSEANAAWEQRVAALWADIDSFDEADFVARMDRLCAELPPEDPIAAFERGGSHDSTGRSDLAVPLYEAALAQGLSGTRRRRATIQLASSLRNLGEHERSIELLEAELAAGHDELSGAVRAVLALALTNAGREREAVSVALTALSEYLPRYNRSLARYAQELVAEES